MEQERHHLAPLAEDGERRVPCVGCGAPVEGHRCPECGIAHRAGPYQVERVVARTVHSRVYLARDAAGRSVALKELLFAQAPDTQAIEAFEREAAMLRGLSHPEIPRFEAAFSEGRGPALRLYLASTFVEGESLAARLTRGRLADDEALELALRVLRILEYLQARSPVVLHRDIKPANLMYRPDGSVCLVDFGSSRQLEGAATHRSTLVGTFGYMPPEQLGGSVDRSSDVYSLAATVLHGLTGRAPEDLIGPDLAPRLPEGVSRRWRPWLARALAPRPAARFADAATALGALETGEGVGADEADEAAHARRRAVRPLLTLALLAASLATGLWLVGASGPTRPVAPSERRAPVPPLAVRVEHDPDLEALSRIHLPAGADAAQTREYIQRVLAVSRDQRTYLRADPQVGKLVEVGAQHADLLVEATDDNVPLGQYPAWALERVATEAHKGLVLEHLRHTHRLAIVVLAKGWQKDARDVLVEGLRGYTGYMPEEWLRALASLHEPSTYGVLTEYLVNGWNRFSTYQVLVGVPGLELDEPLRRAWEASRSLGTNDWEVAYLTPHVLATGSLPALELVFETLDTNLGVPTTGYNARNLALRYTEATGSNEELARWFKANRGKLRFDSERRKFVVGA